MRTLTLHFPDDALPTLDTADPAKFEAEWATNATPRWDALDAP
jgi:hypothetical protein